ncbi:MAG: hypothetical protein J1F04_10445 [Oscillospiraceae bacterium]|nr:hypothetical protein [Oscillospiraceae bacterium]
MTCTFFGHRNTPRSVRGKLKETLIDLIENKGADMFYVGNHGSFDRMTVSVLKELKAEYTNIDFRIVLAYLPNYEVNSEETEFPEGIEAVPKKYAISFRNKWMVGKADTVIAYLVHDQGGRGGSVRKACRAPQITCHKFV